MENHAFLMGISTISMAIFNCYVSSPEGNNYDWFPQLLFKMPPVDPVVVKPDKFLVPGRSQLVQGDQFRGNKQVKEWKRPLLIMNNVMECS